MSKLLKKKLLLWSFLLSKRWFIVSSKLQMFLIRFWWFPPHPPIHLRSKMKKLLTSLVSLNVVSSNLAEKALPQYSELLSTLTQDPVENVKAFDYKESWLDDVLKSILSLAPVISHEQASVGRGFNTTKSISKVNLSEKSILSRKMVIDHMQKTVYYHQLLS